MSAESATSRLTRLLTMVPWLLNRQGIDIDEAARTFGVSRRQLEKDLELLFLCGTPGHMPDDLIEAEWEGGRVYLGNADTIARPLRLGVDEALALIVGLRALATVPGLEERDAIDRALAKLESAAGDLAGAGAHVAVTLDGGVEPAVLADARRGVAGQRMLHLRYLVASRDETTEREVSPMRVFAVDGHWYLEGWCHRADGVRLFRLDRVVALDVLDRDGTPPPQARSRELSEGTFAPGPDDLVVTLRLEPGAEWVADYYPVESTERDADGLTVTLRTADTAWLERLVWRLGGQGRVVEPRWLARQVEAGAARALAAYEGPGTTVDD